MTTFYNEYEPFAAKWLDNLQKAGKISAGVVDGRDFRELKQSDVSGHERCHFFAGIGGWDLALNIAGWEGPVWTASLPCQPFSIASVGRKREEDARHLFPDFARLVSECLPPIIFGEQVASKDGRLWLAGVRSEMEALGYSVGAADLCAAGVGAPHIRQRLFWVARRLADAERAGDRRRPGEDIKAQGDRQEEARKQRIRLEFGPNGKDSRLPDAERMGQSGESRRGAGGEPALDLTGHDAWESEWIACADGKARRLKPGIAPLAHGVPGRVGLIRGYGNAIVPQVAAEFVAAFMETL